MKQYLKIIVSVLLVVSLSACFKSHKDEIVETVDGYLSILKSGENLDSRDDYCTNSFAGDLSSINDQLDQLVSGDEVGTVFANEAKDFIRICFMNFISDYTIKQIDESDKEAIVTIEVKGVNFNTFRLDAYDDQIIQVRDEYVNAHMSEYEDVYNKEGQQAAYERLYDDSSKVVFDEMKKIVSSLDKETYTIIAIVVNDNGTWKIDNLVIE